MDILDKHRADVEEIQKTFLHLQNKEICSLQKSKNPSNVTRAPDYKCQGAQLDINALNRILHIDPIDQVVLAEPRVTMEQLAKATLQYGMMVPVIPEFKGITIGGAIMGTGLESSSHRFGLFSDQCISYEILLGDGSIICATPHEHADLFYGLVGSYGSLGIILSVKLKLIRVHPWVKLTYRRFHRISDAVQHFSRFSKIHTGPNFLEGFVFRKDHIALVEGSYMSLEEGENISPAFSQKYPWSPWFYPHAKELTQAHEIKQEKMPLYDYLFRHDRGAFWMGSYGTEWAALPRYFLESRFKLPTLARLLPKGVLENGPKEPGFLYRFLLGWAMTSHRLYSWLHAHSEEWVRKQCIIQDFCIPMDQVTAFIEKALDTTGILPFWLCPISSVKTAQIFSPHAHSSAPLLINVGIYGVPSALLTPSELIGSLEEWTKEAKGRKMLYSYSHYTPEEFWQIYSKQAYERLRKAYHAPIWTDIDTKVLMRKP